MSAYKDKEKGTWYASFRYKDWKGQNIQKMKRGFKTKKEALAWEQAFKQQQAGDPDMLFEDFIEIYKRDMASRLKKNTWQTKNYVIDKKILPAFQHKKLREIRPSDVIHWQNELLAHRDKQGKAYSSGYLKTVHNQLSAIFNYAVRFYDLSSNPAAKAGNMGKETNKEMQFWTKEEYLKFADSMMDKPISYYAFEMLYWCGIREGDADGKISLNQQKPSKHAGLRRFGPEKFLQRNNEFMKERPIFYKKPIKTEKDFSTWLRCFYYTTKAVITEYIYF